MNVNAATSPRIAPLEPPYTPEVETLLAKWMPAGADVEPLKLFRTLAVHDELAARMRPLGAGILGHGRVSIREREIMILRTCARLGAEYEWGVHAVAFGPAAGLDERQLDSTAAGSPDDDCWSPSDALLLVLADELHERAVVSDAIWAELEQRFPPDQLLELVVIAGWYRIIGSVINSLGVRHEEWARRFPGAED